MAHIQVDNTIMWVKAPQIGASQTNKTTGFLQSMVNLNLQLSDFSKYAVNTY